jgi:hypothetical protein
VSNSRPVGIAPAMSSNPSSRRTPAHQRTVVCKPYHSSTSRGGRPRKKEETKSRCPQWADDPRVRQALLNEALIDPSGGEDVFGNPRKLWNAIEGCYFIGRSCNTSVPQYDCYPEYFPSGKLYTELRERALRRLRDYMSGRANRDE